MSHLPELVSLRGLRLLVQRVPQPSISAIEVELLLLFSAFILLCVSEIVRIVSLNAALISGLLKTSVNWRK